MVTVFPLKKLVPLFLIAVLSSSTIAQRNANMWYFGEYAGLNFTKNSPVPVSSNNMVAYGSPAIASDSISGQLLFYSNGEQVWNRLHEVMPDGSDLIGSSLATNSAYIIPAPGENHIYYLFTIVKADFPMLSAAKIFYSRIDLRLQGGLGNVVTGSKNILVADGVTEKIAAVPKANGHGYWLVAHGFNNDQFLVYDVTSDGISSAQVYPVGAIHHTDNTVIAAQGHMKFSPEGSKLAVTLRSFSSPTVFQVFDFDTETGIVSNAQSLGSYSVQFGVSFSPDSKKLYLQGYAIEGSTYDYLYQFDLEAPDIFGSRTGLLINNPFLSHVDFGAGYANFDLQLGPDGRLYSAGSPSAAHDQEARNSLFVISAPNEKGYACNVTVKKFAFGKGKVNTGLPNFIQSIFKNLTPGENPNAACDKAAFDIYPNPVTTLLNFNISELCNNQFTVSVIDALGRLMLTKYINAASSSLDFSKLAPGAYMVMVTSTTRSFVIKIVKI